MEMLAERVLLQPQHTDLVAVVVQAEQVSRGQPPGAEMVVLVDKAI